MGIAPDAISHEEFADAIFAGASHSGHVWQHFLGYFDQRHRPEVMLVCFEDLKDNLGECVERIARHMGAGNVVHHVHVYYGSNRSPVHSCIHVKTQRNFGQYHRGVLACFFHSSVHSSGHSLVV